MKKLELKKEVIMFLENESMRQLKGGGVSETGGCAGMSGGGGNESACDCVTRGCSGDGIDGETCNHGNGAC